MATIPTEQKLRILLVEDDEDFREALQTRLSKRGFDLTTKTTAEEALEIVAKEEFDAVVSDIKLPTMDGVEFLKKVRETRDGIPVILLTGYASLESAQEAIRLNAFDYLLKPLENINELTGPLNKAIQTYHLQKENERLTSELQEKIKELEERTTILQRFQDFAVGRELKMVQLKEEVNELLKQLGKPEKYKSPTQTAERSTTLD